MLHARNFCESESFRRDNYDFDPATEGSRNGAPLVAQVAGDDPHYMSEAARILERTGVDAIDVNLGCPQNIARKGNYGAYLLPQTDVVCEVIRAMRGSVSTPITAKVRIQPDLEDTVRICQLLVDAGACMLAVHGRTVDETKTSQGSVDLGAIKAVVDSVPVPVIANGGVEFPSDVSKVVSQTGAVGVMSSEALLENPSLFACGRDDGGMSGREIAHRQLELCEEVRNTFFPRFATQRPSI